MNFFGKKLIAFLEFVQNIFKMFQLGLTIVGIVVIFYWIIYQISTPFFQGITCALGIVVDPLIFAFKAFYSFSTSHNGQNIDVTPIILAASLFGIAFIFDYLAVLTNLSAAKIFEIMDDLSFKIEENEKQYILEQVKKETLKFNKLHLHLSFSQANNDIADLTEEMNKSEIQNTLNGIIKHAEKFDCYKTVRVGQGFSFILSFKSKVNLINFINFIKEQIKSFNQEAKMYGLNINYKGAIECTKVEDSSEVITFLRKVIRFCNNDEIMLSSLTKKYLEYESSASLEYEISGKGIYTTERGTIELFSIKLITPLKCKPY